jgi:hypothetical protein
MSHAKAIGGSLSSNVRTIRLAPGTFAWNNFIGIPIPPGKSHRVCTVKRHRHVRTDQIRWSLFSPTYNSVWSTGWSCWAYLSLSDASRRKASSILGLRVLVLRASSSLLQTWPHSRLLSESLTPSTNTLLVFIYRGINLKKWQTSTGNSDQVNVPLSDTKRQDHHCI